MDNKLLVLYYDNGIKQIFHKCFIESGIQCRSWLKNNAAFAAFSLMTIVKKIRKFCGNSLYYYPENYDGLIILFDTKLSEIYLRTIRQKNPEARIILWYWNEIQHQRLLKFAASLQIDTWSYSPADCKKYDLLYNSQFFFDSAAERYRSLRDQQKMQGKKSFIFIGREKGRAEQIRMISEEIQKCGWACETEFRASYMSDRPKDKRLKYKIWCHYDEYLENVLEYSGILDVAYQPNSGLSLRTLESIFFHKKLITTNPLVKDCDFYDENNIYVWGHSDMSLSEFLSRPYRPVPDSICQPYLISSWASRFFAYYESEAGISQ